MTEPFKLKFDVGTIKHLGVMMYSTLPPVIGELVSNAWDADAHTVEIHIPTGALTDADSIVVTDDGSGMTDEQVREAYLIVGRDRREADGRDTTDEGRKVMGRKGIGKFSAFGVAQQIEVETVKDGHTSRFILDYKELAHCTKGEIFLPPLPPTGTVTKGTKVTLHKILKYRSSGVRIQELRRGLARRFSIIGIKENFQVEVNGDAITPEERDLTRLLQNDSDGNPYIWRYDNEELYPGSGLLVSGWIGALDRTSPLEDGIQRGVAIFARGKMVQEPFVFDAVVGQQYALSYMVGELTAEFVDADTDTISTARNNLVWDTDSNKSFKHWGQREIQRIAREWAEMRSKDNELAWRANTTYMQFIDEVASINGGRGIRRQADTMIKKLIEENPLGSGEEVEPIANMFLDYMRVDAFNEMAEEINAASPLEVHKLLNLFRECAIIEAKEMMKVTETRITTITKFQDLIDRNALEVPTLHKFLKEFPWVLDPRWNLIADEVHYSDMLRAKFGDEIEEPDENKRIDFLCVRESNTLVVVEIKRPHSRISRKELNQLKEYVYFIRELVDGATDPSLKYKDVVGYLLCGDTVDTAYVREEVKTLSMSNMYVRKFRDLLGMVKQSHREFLTRYEQLRQNKLKEDAKDEAEAATAAVEAEVTASMEAEAASSEGERSEPQQ